MIIVKPLIVTESNLTSSNIPENDADEWMPSTPYNTGDEVIYEHRVYESLEDANEDQPDEGAIAESPSWLDLGPTNRYRMWDSVPAPQSIRSNNIDVTVTPDGVINAVGLINVNANSVTVQVIDPVEGVVYSQTRSLQDVSEITSWYNYFFEPITVKNDLVFLDLPNYAAPVRVIVNAGAGTASVGEAILGRQQELGCTQYGSSLGLRDYSRVEQDDFGNYDITRRRFSKTFDYDVIVERESAATVQRALTRVRSTATLFIGKEDREETIIYGFYQDMQIVLTQPTYVDMNVECESLPYEEIEAIFDGGAVSTPTITQPENGFTVPEGGSFRSSAFAAVPDSDSHESSSWQIATDAAFESIAYEELADVADLIEWTPDWGYLVESTEYYVRVLHRGTTFGDSSWSPGVMFIAGPELSIDTPTITSPEDGDTFARNQMITSSAFAYTSDVITAHEATQWQIATDAGFTMLEYDDVSESSLTTLAVPSALTNGDTLYVRCRYRDSYGIFSSYSTGVEFVVGEPLGQFARTTSGTTNWVCPANVTRISLVGVGPGGNGALKTGFPLASQLIGPGGGGGALAYAYDVPVTPGQSYLITVGANASDTLFGAGPILRARAGGNAAVVNGAQFGSGDLAGAGGTWTLGAGIDGGGGNGGSGERGATGTNIDNGRGGGGGAGGYGGNGGQGGNPAADAPNSGTYVYGGAGANGSGSGGSTYWPEYDPSSNTFLTGESTKRGTAGGGVGIFGIGSSGAAPTAESLGGKGGSGGGDASVNESGGFAYAGGAAGLYGGGGAAGSNAQPGALRIIYGQLPDGSYRSYPSTGVADM